MPILSDRSAGAAHVFAGPDCERLAGAGGLAIDAHGDVFAAVSSRNRVAQVDPEDVSTIVEGGLLDAPASVEIGTLGDKPYLVIANSADHGSEPAGQPGLLEYVFE